LAESTVCVYGTGSLTPEYVRNVLLIEALETAGFHVIYCSIPAWTGTRAKIVAARGGSLLAALRFAFIQIRLLCRYLLLTGRHDLVLVVAPGHLDIPIARLGTWLRGKPLVFDAFYSLYDTVVSDRGLCPDGSLRASIISFVDGLSCRLSDKVLIDTCSNRDFVSRRYRLRPDSFAVIPAGAPRGFDGEPAQADGVVAGQCTVLFHGSYVPLQGALVVAQAAEILARDHPDIRFRMVGDGQTRQDVASLAEEKGLTSLAFVDWLPLEGLAEEVRKADICLGIFGTSGKASRVIPHKVYAAMAMGKPIITADTPAARELLEDGKTALLCRPGDPGDLSASILRLSANPSLRTALGRSARSLFVERAATGVVARRLAGLVCSLMARSGRRPMSGVPRRDGLEA